MNSKMKKILIGVLCLLVFVALVVCAPVSRLVYSIYDNNRTNEILAQLEAEKAAAQESESTAVNTFHKQAYLTTAEETDGDKKVETTHLLVLTSENTYELNFYERTVKGESAYTSEYFRMTGAYTREGNMLTVEPGIGVLALSQDGSSYTYYNAQYLTAEEAAGDKTRDEVYDMKYASRQIALMQDGSFVVGGKSDASDVLAAPAGRRVYTDFIGQGRKTYKTLVTLDNGTYYVYSQATNSNNAEQTTGALFGYSTYVITDANKGIVPDETKPEETYDIVTGEAGLGYMYANNNGSHMHFDLQTKDGFLSWLSTNFNASSPTFYVSESGFTLKIGALKTVVNPWGLYVPSGDTAEPEATEAPAAQEAFAAQDVRLELETSVEGKPFLLELKADGTLRTGWTNYEQTMMDGSWKVEGGNLVLDVAYPATVVANADGSLNITVNYGQMGEKVYTMTAEQLVALTGAEAAAPAGQDVTLELETSVEGKPFVLALKADGTLRTGWTNYEQTMMDGTWKVEGGNLVLDGAYPATIVANADGSLTITVKYGQMGEKVYTMTAEQLTALTGAEVAAPAGQDVTLELETSVEGKPFVLALKADGTLRTGWTNYEQTMMDGSWKVEGGTLVLDMPYASTIADNNGALDITVNYGQMGEKVYTMTAEQLVALTGAEVAAPAGQDVTLELETSVEGKPFILALKADGTLRTGWTNYEQTMMDGTWRVEGGKLVLDMPYASTIADNNGSLDITVNYGQMGEKVYTMTAEQFAALTGVEAAAPAGQDVTLELETSVKGKPFVLALKADGTLRTGWTNYEQTMMDGSWKVEGGTLVLDMPYTSTIADNNGALDITVNYGQMGEKVYTMSAEQFAALTGMEAAAPAGQDVTLELETSVEGKPFVLALKADGTLRTGWTNYEQTMMDGSWKVEGGKLVLDMPYTSTIADNNGALDITVNYGQMGEKVYTMTAEQFAALTGAEAAAPARQDVTLELETSVEGKPFVLALKADGTLRTGWTNYEQTMMDGSWKVEGGKLVLDMPYTSTIADNNGALDITVNYGQMGEKVYTMTAEQFALLVK